MLTTALFLLAAATQAQAAPADMGPPPEFMQAAQAYGQCIGGGVRSADAKQTPEAAAQSVIATCKAQREAIATRFESWIAGSAMPDEAKTMARAQFKTEMDKVPAQIADGIRKSRETPATPAK